MFSSIKGVSGYSVELGRLAVCTHLKERQTEADYDGAHLDNYNLNVVSCICHSLRNLSDLYNEQHAGSS